MNRAVDDRNILDVFCEEFCGIVQKHTDYVIVSGFLAIALGRMRGTEDIDMILPKLDVQTFTNLHVELEQNNFECVQSQYVKEIFSYLKENISVRYVRKNTYVPEMEIKFAKDELDNTALRTKTFIPQTQLDIYFSEPELNIAVKEELLRSDKDMEDAKHTRILLSPNEDKITMYKQLVRRCRL